MLLVLQVNLYFFTDNRVDAKSPKETCPAKHMPRFLFAMVPRAQNKEERTWMWMDKPKGQHHPSGRAETHPQGSDVTAPAFKGHPTLLKLKML